jgi:hypothetical protein
LDSHVIHEKFARLQCGHCSRTWDEELLPKTLEQLWGKQAERRALPGEPDSTRG